MTPGASTRLDQILGGTTLDPALWQDSSVHSLLVDRIEVQARRIHGLSSGEAESVARDVLAELWKARERYDGESPVKGYVGGILRHLAHAARRSRIVQPAAGAADPPDRGPDAPGVLSAAELAAAIDEAGGAANSGDAEAYRLLAAPGATVDEVCRQLDILPNALHQRVARFRAVVKKRLQERGFLGKGTPRRATSVDGSAGIRATKGEGG